METLFERLKTEIKEPLVKDIEKYPILQIYDMFEDLKS